MILAKEQPDMPTARKKSITSRKELYIAFTHELFIPEIDRKQILNGA